MAKMVSVELMVMVKFQEEMAVGEFKKIWWWSFMKVGVVGVS